MKRAARNEDEHNNLHTLSLCVSLHKSLVQVCAVPLDSSANVRSQSQNLDFEIVLDISQNRPILFREKP